MKCSCPHMGNYYMGFETLFRQVGIDFFPSPPITKRTVELGVKFSPEFVCFPFKVNLGNLIEALEEGADILFQSGGRGACRYGAYLDLQKEILRDLGFNFQLFRLFDTSNIRESWSVLKRLNPKITFKRLLKAIWIALAKIRAIDRIEDDVRRKTAYIEDKREVEKIREEYFKYIKEKDKPVELKEIVKDFENRLRKMMDFRKRPLRIGIVGELYVVMEPYSNLELERKLLELDTEIVRPLCLSGMLKEFFSLGLSRLHYLKIARPYLRFDCVAHSNVSVAETIIFSREGIDGVIHIKPHACMPEVTAMNALYRVSRDYNIPILFLSFDEHTSSVGLKTRLESFVELLARRRKKDVSWYRCGFSEHKISGHR